MAGDAEGIRRCGGWGGRLCGMRPNLLRLLRWIALLRIAVLRLARRLALWRPALVGRRLGLKALRGPRRGRFAPACRCHDHEDHDTDHEREAEEATDGLAQTKGL